MHVINAENVNHAYTMGMNYLLEHGEEHDSRVGKVLRSSVPVSTVYANPCERVLFNRVRDCNPFFHLFESIWMMTGSNEVEPLLKFNSRMGDYSDDGKTLNGAYGYRWINYFGFNQIENVVDKLKANPNDRRCVISMWDAFEDLKYSGKDAPCNDMIKFSATNGKLEMIVFNRSNDIIWGAYGANVVHMSFLQEYMAAAIGIPVGTYTQISCDFHAYVDILEKKKSNVHCLDKYLLEELSYQPLILEDENPNDFLSDCSLFFDDNAKNHFDTRFFGETVLTMKDVHHVYKKGKKEGALGLCANIGADDWRVACSEWIERRIK